MSSFFQQTAQSLLNQYPDDFPLFKINYILDWQAIEQMLLSKRNPNKQETGRPAYAMLPMFKAVLLGQWHSLSDPELERALITRLDFFLFCGFDELNIPDHCTLNRFRNWLMIDNTLEELISLINQQLSQNNLKVKKAQAAIVDATIIQSAGGKLRKAIETKEDNEIVDTPPSKDSQARWTIKGGHWHLGYKAHIRTDEEGYIEKVEATPANVNEINCLEPLLEGVAKQTPVFADKGYDSKDNRDLLKEKQLKNRIMCRAKRNKSLTPRQVNRNKRFSKIRYRVEQSFAILHRQFLCKRASYFGTAKVKGQIQLKAICLNLLKAANKLKLVAPIAV